MLKKLFLLTIIVALLIAYLGGIFSISFSPFFLTISRPEKDFLKKIARGVKSIIYREATEHNPAGDVLPDQIDDRLKQEVKEKIN